MAIEQLESQDYQDPRFDDQGKLKEDPRFDEHGRVKLQYLGAMVNEATGDIIMHYSEEDGTLVPVPAAQIIPMHPKTAEWLRSQKRAY